MNEAGTIGAVTKLVDQGLKELSLLCGKTIEAKIINVDSESDDDTANVFKKTDTFFPKQSIILSKPRGKGKNLLAFMRVAKQEKADCCLTIDADIRSAKVAWITELLKPVLNNEADYVTPLYARSRFEGSSTNHFAYPIVLAAGGENIRQPIAGDFAFNSKLIDVIQNSKIPDPAHEYGIDIFLTLSALTNHLRLVQVELDEKMHNPSFNKLEYMFPQIAASTLFLLRGVKMKTASRVGAEATINNIASSSVFPHREDAVKMKEHSLSQLASADFNKWGWVQTDIAKEIKKFDSVGMKAGDWVNILSSWLKYGLQNKNVSPLILAEQLLPFFVIRATTFWFSSENMSAEEVEKEIHDQAISLNSSF